VWSDFLQVASKLGEEKSALGDRLPTVVRMATLQVGLCGLRVSCALADRRLILLEAAKSFYNVTVTSTDDALRL